MSTINLKYLLIGAKDALALPGLVLIITFFAFGALANTLGANLLTSLGLTAFIFAIPGQVILLDEFSRSENIAAAFLATSLTAVRLLPLTMSMMPVMRSDGTPKWLEFIVAHFIAVTVWVQSMTALPNIERIHRPSYCLGLCFCLLLLTTLATFFGFLTAPLLPPKINAALLMVTPIYFFLTLLLTSNTKQDWYAFLFGGIICLGLMFVIPDFALLSAGILGGTIAYLLERAGRQKK